MLKKVSKRESVPGRVDERKSQRAIELWRIWACDGGPILARLGICSSQSDVRCVGAGASATATATALAEAINIVDTRTKKRSGFLPGCPVLALIEDDKIDVGLAAQGSESRQPPSSRRERVLQNPGNAMTLKDSDEAQSCAHTLVAHCHALDHICRLVLHLASPRIVAAAVSKSIDARKRTARRSEHGSQKLPLRSVLLYLSQNTGASQVVRLSVQTLPLTSLKPNAPHSTCDAADSTEEVGHVSSFHARGGGPNGGNR